MFLGDGEWPCDCRNPECLEDCLRGRSVVAGIQGLQACTWEITLCLITRYFLEDQWL